MNHMKEIQDIVSLLESTQFVDRAKGSDRLNSLVDSEKILMFHQYAEDRDHYGLRLSFQKLLYRLLRGDNEYLIGLSLSILFSHSILPKKGFREESERQIDEFLNAPNTYQYLKFSALKKAWKMLGPKERFLATKKIGSFQMVEVLSILLDNFQSDDPSLMILTMEVFRRLKDKRANRLIRQLMDQNSRADLKIKALLVISELGYFLDKKIFIRHLNSEDEEIRLAALEGLYVLKGDKAIPLIKNFFFDSKAETSQIRLIGILSRKPTTLSILALLDIWQNQDFSAVEHEIDWALNEMEGPSKLDALLQFYSQANPVVRLKMISLLNEIQNQRCYDFYINLINEHENDLLTMAALEAVSYYNDVRTLPHLEKFLRNPEDMLHYYALATYVKHTSIDLTEMLEKTILYKLPDDRHHHQLILNVLSEQNSIKMLSLFLKVYVLTMLNSSRKDNRYLAFSVVKRFIHDFELSGIFAVFTKEENEMVANEALSVFGEIFSIYPEIFMKANPPENVLASPAFAKKVKLNLPVLKALFLAKRKQHIVDMQLKEPHTFWVYALELFNSRVINDAMISWINLAIITFEDFSLIWDRYQDDEAVKSQLLKSISISHDPRFGDFLLGEYFKDHAEELYPYVSRYVNGLA
jgi:HEAT repeat protein